LINALREGFATICSGASTLELFPHLTFGASPKFAIQPSSAPFVPQSYTVQDVNLLPRALSSCQDQDALSLTKDRKQIESDLRYVMRRLPVDKKFL